MKTKNKASGFFIIEILIVLVLVALLTLILVPNYTTYVDRAKFQDVIMSVEALKPAVSACILQQGLVDDCNTGSNGIPSATSAGYLASLTVSAGEITGTGTAAGFSTANQGTTYILTPVFANGVITWSDSGTCVAKGLC